MIAYYSGIQFIIQKKHLNTLFRQLSEHLLTEISNYRTGLHLDIRSMPQGSKLKVLDLCLSEKLIVHNIYLRKTLMSRVFLLSTEGLEFVEHGRIHNNPPEQDSGKPLDHEKQSE